MRNVSWYGWLPDLPDHRDLLYTTYQTKLLTLPSMVDLRLHSNSLFPVYSQGPLGSCTSQAIAKAVAFAQVKATQGMIQVQPSRLFIYYNERRFSGTEKVDAGAQLRDGIKAVVVHGVCDEQVWPYDVTKVNEEPPEEAYEVAMDYQAVSYRRLNNDLGELQHCLASGFPFVFGMAVYESFESDRTAHTGEVILPGKRERQVGGHAVLAIGYDDEKQQFLVQNSWGDDWGQHGCFTLPYEYATNPGLCADRWVITMMENAPKN